MTEKNLSGQTEILNTKARPAKNLDERTVEEQKSTLKQFYSEIKKGVEAGTIKVLNKENTKDRRLKASVTDTHGDVVSLIISLINSGAEPEENKFLYYVNRKYYYKDESKTRDVEYHEYNPYGNPKIGDVVKDKTIIKNIENNSTVVPFFNTDNAIELEHLGDVIDRGSESLTSILTCETCDSLKLIQGNHEFCNSVSNGTSQLPVINGVLARMKKNKEIAISRYEGKGNKVVAYSHTPLTQIGISCIFDFLNDYIRGDLFDGDGNKADLSVKSNVFNALDKEFKNHKNLFNKLQTFLLNCEKSDFKDINNRLINNKIEKQLMDFYEKIIDEGNFTKEELLIIKNIVGDALNNRKIDDDGKKKMGEFFNDNYQFFKLILVSNRGTVNVLNFYDEKSYLTICEHIKGHTVHKNSVTAEKENNDKKAPKGNEETNENNKITLLNVDISRSNGNHEYETYGLTTIIDKDIGEVENCTCVVYRGKDNEILNIEENKEFKCDVTKLENYVTKPFEKDKTESYDFANDVSKTNIDENGKVTITFNNDQEITLNSLDNELDCIGRNAVFAIFAGENNLNISNEKHKEIINGLLNSLMEQENNRHKRDLINMVLSNCNNVDIINYILDNEKVSSFLKEIEKTIEKNKKIIENNKKIIENNEETIENDKETIKLKSSIIYNNKKNISKINKTIEKNKNLITDYENYIEEDENYIEEDENYIEEDKKKKEKLIEENKNLEEERNKLIEENKNLIEVIKENDKKLKENESLIKENKKLKEESKTTFLSAFLLNKEIFNEENKEKINKIFESINIENFGKYFKENITNNEEEKNKFFSVLMSSDNSYLLEYLNNNKLLNEQDYKILLEKGVVYNRTKIFDKVCEIVNNSEINLLSNDNILGLLQSAIKNENIDIFNKLFNMCEKNNLKIEIDDEVDAEFLLKMAVYTKNEEFINKVVKLFKSKNVSIAGVNYSSKEKEQDLQNLINTVIFSLDTDNFNKEENEYVIDVFKKLNNTEEISDIDFSKIDRKNDFFRIVLATDDSVLINKIIRIFEEKKYFNEINKSYYIFLLEGIENIDMVEKLLSIYKNQNPKEFKNFMAESFYLEKFLTSLISVNDTGKINVILKVIKDNNFEIRDSTKECNIFRLLKLAIERENMEIFNSMIEAFENKSFKIVYERASYNTPEKSYNKKNLKEFLELNNGYKSLIDEAQKTNNAYVIKTVEEKLNEIKNGKKEELEKKAENNIEEVVDNSNIKNSNINANSNNDISTEGQLEEITNTVNSDNGNLDSTEISEEAESLEQLISDLTTLSRLGEKREKNKNILVHEKERELINRYNFYVKNNKELKLKTIKIKEKNKHFQKENHYMYVKVKELNNVIKDLGGEEQQKNTFTRNWQ